MLISIIVPVYNAHKHLRNCIESVMTQTYKNLDMIFLGTVNCLKKGQAL